MVHFLETGRVKLRVFLITKILHNFVDVIAVDFGSPVFVPLFAKAGLFFWRQKIDDFFDSIHLFDDDRLVSDHTFVENNLFQSGLGAFESQSWNDYFLNHFDTFMTHYMAKLENETKLVKFEVKKNYFQSAV